MASQKPREIAQDISLVRTRLIDSLDQILVRSQPNRIIDSQVQKAKAFYLDEKGGVRLDRAGKTIAIVLVLAIVRKLFK